MVFKQEVVVAGMVAEIVWWRVVWWFKSCVLGSPLSPSILGLNLNAGCVDVVKNQRSCISRWCPLSEDVLKFNVDGSLRGNLGSIGIGGILRNHDGDSICMFSIFLGDGLSSSVVELATILKACKLGESGNCPAGVSIVIKIDCKCAIRWVNMVGAVDNARNLDSIFEIRKLLCRNSLRVSVKCVPRNSNVAMDLLTKLGALSGLDQVVWSS
ncbi:hypothetical protein LWI28_026741 [Acer negundo]|uniref:RNase H type-1 domain-containing protein n=1 Tax=Acer negundo TaxID=4023 RepID=A0AAD5NQZ0_ACENE|nr:hypothetical protein LWI28_026741 [Acer negundo]